MESKEVPKSEQHDTTANCEEALNAAANVASGYVDLALGPSSYTAICLGLYEVSHRYKIWRDERSCRHVERPFYPVCTTICGRNSNSEVYEPDDGNFLCVPEHEEDYFQ